jgi:hypothetical protein
MRAILGGAGILVVLVIGCYLFSYQSQQGTKGNSAARSASFVAVRRDLLSLGQSERLYWATNGSYATLEELRQSKIMNSLPDGNRLGYRYTVEVGDAAHFRITASPIDASNTDLPNLFIDETMKLSQ